MKISPVMNAYIKSYVKNIKHTNKAFKEENLPLKSMSCENYKALYFTGDYRPVAAIDIKTGKTQFFPSGSAAEAKLNMSKNTVRRVILHQDGRYNEYIFVGYESILQRDNNGDFIYENDGTMKTDRNKIWKIINRELFSAINLKTNEVQTFSSSIQAAKALNIKPANLNASLAGKVKKVQDYIFVPFETLQLKDDKGNIVFDENSMPMIDKNKLWKAIGSRTISAIDMKTHEIRTFTSQVEASKELNITANLISRCINGSVQSAHGYRFAFSWELWEEDENENIIFDENGLPKIDENKLFDIIYHDNKYYKKLLQKLDAMDEGSCNYLF